ncbi:MAG: alpha/beta hydrolase [Pseudomonadota bacterium]|nr:alpha/beta hydrolase [Pseudomonadota bacterium]
MNTLSLSAALLLALAPALATAQPQAQATQPMNTPTQQPLNITQTWDKTFPRSDKVEHRKIQFTNRFGITLVGDLYIPRQRGEGKLPAIAVGGPFGAVKEQSSGLYAQTMAERGFVTLAFDPSYTGESGGSPRNIASPDINTEDFSAAVDALGLQPLVDRERIGIIGICGWGGMALNAAAADTRIKAVVASTMYDISRVSANGYNDSLGVAERAENLRQIAQQRWVDADKGSTSYGPVMNELHGGEPQFMVEYADYYRTPRGFHPRAVNSNASWSLTNSQSFINTPQMARIAEITPRPILLVHGENAHSRYMSETAYAAASSPKELLIIPGANHTDLYDKLDVIPFDALQRFFEANLD